MHVMKSLGRVRAEKTGCAKAWTPIEMLQDLLREAESGELKLEGAIIIFPTDSDTSNINIAIRKAGIDSDDELVMLRSAYMRATGL